MAISREFMDLCSFIIGVIKMFDSNYEEYPGVSFIFVGYWLELIIDDVSGIIIPIYELYN